MNYCRSVRVQEGAIGQIDDEFDWARIRVARVQLPQLWDVEHSIHKPVVKGALAHHQAQDERTCCIGLGKSMLQIVVADFWLRECPTHRVNFVLRLPRRQGQVSSTRHLILQDESMQRMHSHKIASNPCILQLRNVIYGVCQHN